jgi:hypothetical protein
VLLHNAARRQKLSGRANCQPNLCNYTSLKPREEGKTSTTTLDEMLLSSRRFSDELPLSTNLVYLTPPARSGLWWSKLTHTATPFEILLEEASCSASTLASFPLLPPTFQSQPKLASFFFCKPLQPLYQSPRLPHNTTPSTCRTSVPPLPP